MSSAPSSPTLCRPQHVDRERLRRLLATDEFAGVRFHEAVVVVAEGDAPTFSLLAMTDDALLLLPLGAGGGASGVSGCREPSALATRVRLVDVAAVERVSPSATRLRGVMLHAASELFRIDVIHSESSSIRTTYVATFEPRSRAFFAVHRTFLVEFQHHIMQPTIESTMVEGGELHTLLEELLAELAPVGDLATRSALLDELATAALGRHALQTLCFATPAAIASAVDPRLIIHGLPAFLVEELALLADGCVASRADARTEGDATLEYMLSLLNLLHALLFGGHWVLARRRFYCTTPRQQWLKVVMAAPPPTVDKCERWRRQKEDLVDLQAALATELQLLQEEEDTEDEQRRDKRESIAHLLQRNDAHDAWLTRLLKRVGVALSRTPHELAAATAHEGSLWSLALWRNSALLRSLLQTSAACSDNSLPSRLRRRRQDEIDVYLKHPRFTASLVASNIPHLAAAAAHILDVVELLQ